MALAFAFAFVCFVAWEGGVGVPVCRMRVELTHYPTGLSTSHAVEKAAYRVDDASQGANLTCDREARHDKIPKLEIAFQKT